MKFIAGLAGFVGGSLIVWGAWISAVGRPCHDLEWIHDSDAFSGTYQHIYCKDADQSIGTVYRTGGSWDAWSSRKHGACSGHFRTEESAKKCVEKASQDWLMF